MRGVYSTTRAGLLIAASVVLTRFFGVMVPLAGVGALRLSFGDVPIIMASLFLGPVWGAAVGAASDLLGFALNPMGGPYFPGFTLTAVLVGVLPALFLRLFTVGLERSGEGRAKLAFWRYLAAIACSDVITSMVLNSYWIHIMYGKALAAILPARIIARLVLIPISAALVSLTAQAMPVSLAALAKKPSTNGPTVG
ncbi:MAG TPA: folate family ECF transporter S component [Bacillota bacterium]